MLAWSQNFCDTKMAGFLVTLSPEQLAAFEGVLAADTPDRIEESLLPSPTTPSTASLAASKFYNLGASVAAASARMRVCSRVGTALAHPGSAVTCSPGRSTRAGLAGSGPQG